MIPRTAAGWVKFRPIRPGGRVALVAPASPFDRTEFDEGLNEIRRLDLEPVYDPTVFDRRSMTAGSASTRAAAFHRAFDELDADAVIAVRGGYGSVEILPFLDIERLRRARTAFVGYSDVTSVHSFLGAAVGMTSVHGVMVEGRLARGPSAYDPSSFIRSLSAEPLGEIMANGVEVLSPGRVSGTLVGGTLTQLLASFETPYAFAPPPGHVLFLDEVNERPYRLHRMLTQWRSSGRFQQAAAVVFGQLPGCDEPGGQVTARDVIAEVLDGFSGPVLMGFPSGHTTTPLVSLPWGVRTIVEAGPGRSRLVIDEAAAHP